MFNGDSCILILVKYDYQPKKIVNGVFTRSFDNHIFSLFIDSLTLSFNSIFPKFKTDCISSTLKR